MASENRTSCFLTLTNLNGQLLSPCPSCGKGGVSENRLYMCLDLIIIGGPKAIILTMDPNRAFLDSATSVVHCSASKAYDRIHSADNIIGPTIITDEIRTLIANALAGVGDSDESRGLGGSDKA